MDESKRQYRFLEISAVLLLILSIYLFMTTRTTLWDRDEPRFTRSAVEMIESGKYLVPSFNGQLWADKPILVYWLMTISIKVFGYSEFACRLWSALGAVISCFLTFLIGKKLFGYREGLFAMIMLASSAMMLNVGSMATSDGVTLPLTLTAMTIFIYGYRTGIRFYHIIFIGIFMGLGMLAKGPIGLLPLPVMIVTLWQSRTNLRVFLKQVFGISLSLAIAIGIFLCWAIPANMASDGQFLNTFIGRHVISRAFKPMEHHGGNFFLYLPYYIPVIIAGFFPWTMVLPCAISASITKISDQTKKLLLGWIVSIVILMSFAATKLPHYIIFIWPALAVVSGAAFCLFEKRVLSEIDTSWLGRGNWFFVPVSGAMAVGTLSVPIWLKVPGIVLPCLILGVILLTLTIISSVFIYKLKLYKAAKTGFAIMIVFQVMVFPLFEKIKVTPPISKAINSYAPADTPVATFKFGEPTLNYYLQRNLIELSNINEAAGWLQQKTRAILIIPDNEYDKIKQQYPSIPCKIIVKKEGYNYSKGKKIQLLAVISEGN